MNMEIQAALDVADETDSFLQITDVIYDKEADLGYNALTDAEKTVFCIDSLLREMENGGFVQFFHHEVGALAEDTLEALERIKSRDTHALLDELIDLFPGRVVPKDEDERIALFDQLEGDHTDEIAQLDERFYEVSDSLVGLTLHFVARNLKGFH
ncbi:DMP19 family protein [Oceanobacter antarcticus]|uniref:DMP19 family protein n=1 Tax=Oceanobacter antarcticus TaxID=3133425 RepID=A0ABW8NN64_9GAMM|tara:strand:- start:3322 stop:3786 length:465 start_codon:yes stop_codon:yes gene_type:complete